MKLFLLVVGVVSVLGQQPQVLEDFSVGSTQFAADVYRELLKSHSGNFLVCPLSANIILALAHTGAKGETAKQIAAGLHLPESHEKVHEIFSALTPSLHGNARFNLSSANKIYVQNNFKISDSFKSKAVDVFNSEIQNIDFAKNVAAASEINKWVEDKTDDNIKDLVKPGDLDGSTVAILVNAMFFQGTWASKFREGKTEKKAFHINAKEQVDTDMMYNSARFNYFENEEAQYLQMHYTGGDNSMVVILAKDVEGLSALENKISEVLAAPKFTDEKVNVELPKFKIETTIQLRPVLQALGIKDAFEGTADFSGIADVKGLSISKVVQKAFIEVDEKGTKAAAATFLDISLSSAPRVTPPKTFTADHPFIFCLKRGSTILFIGRYVSPKQ